MNKKISKLKIVLAMWVLFIVSSTIGSTYIDYPIAFPAIFIAIFSGFSSLIVTGVMLSEHWDGFDEY